MKYRIYEIVEPDLLQHEKDPEYSEKCYQNYVLRKIIISEFDYDVDHEFDSMEDAMESINKRAEDLKDKTFTILPVIEISTDFNNNIIN